MAIGSDDYMSAPELSPRERHAVLWAEHVTRNTARDRRDVWDACREHFSEAEMVELTLMSAFFNMFNRYMDSLKVPLEVQGEVDKIKRSLDLDPAKVKTYMQTVLDNWPDEFPKPNPD